MLKILVTRCSAALGSPAEARGRFAMKLRKLFIQLGVVAAMSSQASAADFRILDRIKVPDGLFDYATFDAAHDRIYMTRSDFTTVIDAKTGAVSQIKSVAEAHLLLPIPDTSIGLAPLVKDSIRLVDLTSDTVVADLPVGPNPDSAAY